ncbi:MAG TPA: M12 family metallopeptidase [Solirubrobacteraceae bacterium]|nr:M12 family metallopeptidase [Solirubrobacteraceae bacterium]
MVEPQKNDPQEQQGPRDRDEPLPYCDVKPQIVPVLAPDLPSDRLSAILRGRSKWVNGTVLHYHFFDGDGDGQDVRFSDGTTRFVTWVGAAEQQDVVRRAFEEWKALGIGLEFEEVRDRAEAEVRIGFMDTDGSWSYVGRDVLTIGAGDRTMNFGWDLTDDYGHTTARHEIGHTLGMPHEHQNPFAGIQWDEEAVYGYFAGPPNRWSRQKTFDNVLRKLAPTDVEGSAWDPASVMEYAFPGGLIREPAQYRAGLRPPGTLSALDAQFIRTWYPPLAPVTPRLTPFQSAPVSLRPGQQVDFAVEPPASRRYQVGTFGSSDTVLVLFEEVDGQLRYLRGDDDSGQDRNARVSLKLFAGRRYVVRVRLYWAGESGETAVMYW